MASVITTPEDVINLALVRIGYKLRIGSIYEGSEAASAALNIYSQTRDELLRQSDWAFASRQAALTLLKAAPANYFDSPWNPATMPPVGWMFEYAYPSDALKIRAVGPQPGFVFNPAPKPHLFNVYNDNSSTPEGKTVVCNLENAIAYYTGQVTNPSDMEPDFIEAFAAALGRRLTPSLVDIQTAGLAVRDEAASQMIAERERG